jgi:hypothetical protein
MPIMETIVSQMTTSGKVGCETDLCGFANFLSNDLPFIVFVVLDGIEKGLALLNI